MRTFQIEFDMCTVYTANVKPSSRQCLESQSLHLAIVKCVNKLFEHKWTFGVANAKLGHTRQKYF